MKRTVKCAHKHNVRDCSECWPLFNNNGTPTPLLSAGAVREAIDKQISFQVNRRLIHEDRWTDLKDAIMQLIQAQQLALLERVAGDEVLVEESFIYDKTTSEESPIVIYTDARNELRDDVRDLLDKLRKEVQNG